MTISHSDLVIDLLTDVSSLLGKRIEQSLHTSMNGSQELPYL